MDLQTLNDKYLVAEEVHGKEPRIFIHNFEDPKRQSAFQALVAVFRAVDSQSVVFEDFRVLLGRLYWDIRAFIGSRDDTSDQWKKRGEQLQFEILKLRSHLDEDLRSRIQDLESSLAALELSDDSFRSALVAMGYSGPTLVAVSKKWQVNALQNLIDAEPIAAKVDIVLVSRLHFVQASEYDRVICIEAPSRLNATTLRLVFLGGFHRSVHFLCSRGSSGKIANPENLASALYPGLGNVEVPLVELLGREVLEGDRELAEASSDDFESLALLDASSSSDNFNQPIRSGATACKLVRLGDGYVMPLEVGLERISVLAVDENGQRVVAFREFGKDLEIGDILFELIDGAEEDFLIASAKTRLGETFHEFERWRSDWKNKVKATIAKTGYGPLVKYLEAHGVTTAGNLDLWINDPSFVSPRSKSDWRNFLKALRYSDQNVDEIMDITHSIRSTLISIGQGARKEMALSVSESDIQLLSKGKLVVKSLESFGNAEFVLARVAGLEVNEYLCDFQDVRHVVRSSDG